MGHTASSINETNGGQSLRKHVIRGETNREINRFYAFLFI